MGLPANRPIMPQCPQGIGAIHDSFSLDSGKSAFFHMPSPITDEERKDIVKWLQLIVRRLKRTAVQSPERPKACTEGAQGGKE